MMLTNCVEKGRVRKGGRERERERGREGREGESEGGREREI